MKKNRKERRKEEDKGKEINIISSLR